MTTLHTLPEVAEILRVSVRMVQRLVATGELQSVKVGGRRLVTEIALERFLRRAEQRGRVA